MTRTGAHRCRLLLGALAACGVLFTGAAGAQEWGFQVGGASGVQYTDNYQLRATDKFSATTLTVAPFVTGYRRTETSQLNVAAGIGYNYVVSSEAGNTDYWSGRLGLNGSTQFDRSSWGFNVGVVRDQTIATETLLTGVNFGTGATRTAATAGLNYGYQLTERWTVGAFGSLYSNSYSQTQTGASLQDNTGYSVGGSLGYALTQRTQLGFALSYSHYASDITDSDSISATLSATHQFSQALTVSAFGGYFWSDITSTQNFFVCPTDPVLCSTGAVAPVQIASNQSTSSGGTLFGGSVNYILSERTSFSASASQSLAPSGVGTITKVSTISAALYHGFSERVRGQLGAGWTKSTIPGANADTFYTEFTNFGATLSYNLTNAWLIEGGVRRQLSDQRGIEANGNIVFVTLAYNWPGQSLSDWSGLLSPISFPAASRGAGTPPEAIPGIPVGAPTPVPRSAAETIRPAAPALETTPAAPSPAAP